MKILALVAVAIALTVGALYAQSTQLVTVGSGTVAVGDKTWLRIELDSAPNGLSGFDMTASVMNPLVAEISGAFFPPFHTDELSLSRATSTSPGKSMRVTTADLAHLVEPGAVDAELVAIDVTGILSGRSTTIELQIDQIDDEVGTAIPVTVQIGTISVEFPILAGATKPVQDLNGDGLAEDINANNLEDFDDVVDFFWAFGEVEVTGNVHVFDFNGNGLIDFDDIVKLFQSIT